MPELLSQVKPSAQGKALQGWRKRETEAGGLGWMPAWPLSGGRVSWRGPGRVEA